jgi:hypothetical protein
MATCLKLVQGHYSKISACCETSVRCGSYNFIFVILKMRDLQAEQRYVIRYCVGKFSYSVAIYKRHLCGAVFEIKIRV